MERITVSSSIQSKVYTRDRTLVNSKTKLEEQYIPVPNYLNYRHKVPEGEEK